MNDKTIETEIGIKTHIKTDDDIHHEEGEMGFLDDSGFSAKQENEILRNSMFDANNVAIGVSSQSGLLESPKTVFDECVIIPKIEKLEKSLDSAHAQIRSHFLILERLKYSFEMHTKQIKILENFIESQNMKNEKIHLEISSLKITVEAIQTQTAIILQTIERVNQNFEKHIGDMESYFFKSSSEKHKKTEDDLDHYKKTMKVGLWIAYSLAAIVILAGAFHTLFAPTDIKDSVLNLLNKNVPAISTEQ